MEKTNEAAKLAKPKKAKKELEYHGVIEITKRKCGKLQPNIKVGNKYIVHGYDKLKDGTEVLLLISQNRMKKNILMRCNAKRFEWREYTEKMAKEDNFKRKVEKSYNELLEKFDFNEHMRICFVPFIVTQCAWHYCDKATKLSAAYRIEDLKKLKRAVDHLESEYDKMLSRDLDFKHKRQLIDQCKKFIATYSKDFTIMEFTVRGEILKVYPDDPYVDMRAYAFISKMLCEYYTQYNKECDLVIANRLGKRVEPTVANPIIESLKGCMDAYMGEMKIDVEHNIHICLKIFAKNLYNIDFEVGHEERIKKVI